MQKVSFFILIPTYIYNVIKNKQKLKAMSYIKQQIDNNPEILSDLNSENDFGFVSQEELSQQEEIAIFAAIDKFEKDEEFRRQYEASIF